MKFNKDKCEVLQPGKKKKKTVQAAMAQAGDWLAGQGAGLLKSTWWP